MKHKKLLVFGLIMLFLITVFVTAKTFKETIVKDRDDYTIIKYEAKDPVTKKVEKYYTVESKKPTTLQVVHKEIEFDKKPKISKK